jgi:hypothetical protein
MCIAGPVATFRDLVSAEFPTPRRTYREMIRDEQLRRVPQRAAAARSERAKAVAAEPGEQPGALGTADDHAARVLARHAVGSELPAAAAAKGGEQRRVFFGREAGRRDIGVEIILKEMVRRHLVLLAAFFVQPYPPALALGIVVVDVHVERGRDPGKAIDLRASEPKLSAPCLEPNRAAAAALRLWPRGRFAAFRNWPELIYLSTIRACLHSTCPLPPRASPRARPRSPPAADHSEYSGHCLARSPTGPSARAQPFAPGRLAKALRVQA